MILDLKKVFLDENSRLSLEIPVDVTDMQRDSQSLFREPVEFHLDIESHAGLVVFEAKSETECYFLCDRCAEPSAKKIAFRFRHVLVAKLSDESDDDYIEAPDYKLDTDALLRDDILLELPSKYLCSNECKGLCPKCGINLNEKTCGCTVKETDPRLEALRKLIE